LDQFVNFLSINQFLLIFSIVINLSIFDKFLTISVLLLWPITSRSCH